MSELEDKRKTIFELKIEALSLLSKSLTVNSSLRLWENFWQVLVSKLSRKEFLILDRIENKLFRPSPSDKIHKHSFVLLGGTALDLTNCLVRVGGLRNILEILEHTERELKIGRMQRMKQKLLAINSNKRISSYYDLLLTGKVDELRDLVWEFHNHSEEDEEENFKRRFNGRLQWYIADNFKKTTKTQSEEKRSLKGGIIPTELPPGTKWEDITIEFTDGHTVRITAPGFRGRTDYIRMGFENKRKLSPNVQWKFLQELAELHGEMLWRDVTETAIRNKKRKQLLSDTLKHYFQIDKDPFLPYKQARKYKSRFHLFPESYEGSGKFTNEFLDHPYQPS